MSCLKEKPFEWNRSCKRVNPFLLGWMFHPVPSWLETMEQWNCWQFDPPIPPIPWQHRITCKASETCEHGIGNRDEISSAAIFRMESAAKLGTTGWVTATWYEEKGHPFTQWNRKHDTNFIHLPYRSSWFRFIDSEVERTSDIIMVYPCFSSKMDIRRCCESHPADMSVEKPTSHGQSDKHLKHLLVRFKTRLLFDDLFLGGLVYRTKQVYTHTDLENKASKYSTTTPLVDHWDCTFSYNHPYLTSAFT